MKFNLNDEATVVLTAYGQSVYDLFHRRLDLKFHSPASSTLTLPLWGLMQIFGPAMAMGFAHVPFVDNEIRIVRWRPGSRRIDTSEVSCWLPLPSHCRSKKSRKKGGGS